MKILIVDDIEINLEIVGEILTSSYGLECTLALSGAEALEHAKKCKYDLILMDHMMPEMDGVETMRRLRETGGINASVPVIALTGNDDKETKKFLLNEGMNDFLAKPVAIEKMTAVLQKWLPSAETSENKNQDEKHNSPFIQAVTEIPDLDVKAGLANVFEKEDVYEKSLKLLMDKIPYVTAQIKDALVKDNIVNFTTYVHGIKSSLATVGAVKLSKLALELELAGKKNNADFYKNNSSFFITNLNELQKKLAPFFNENHEINETHGKGTQEAFAEFMNTLKTAAENYNYAVLSGTVGRMLELDFGEKSNNDVIKLKRLIDAFDYEGVNNFNVT